jgi:gamma-glutamylcysteine synthetase
LGRKDILTLLHQIFTHVRFKNVVEIRGMDRPPKGFEMAPVAFWIGILMSEKSREELSDIVEEWSHEDRLALETAVKILDVSQPGPNGKSLEEWLYILCDIALSGLKERAEKFDWDNEDKYLTPFLSEIKSKGIFTLSIQNEFRNSGRPLRQFLMERKAIV